MSAQGGHVVAATVDAVAVADTVVLTRRSLRHVTRSPDTIITTAVLPIAFLLLFVFVFGGAIDLGPGGGPYVDYLLPGILVITIAQSVSYASYRLFQDLQGGIVERLQSMPIARSSVLAAHVVTSLAATLVSLVLVVALALAIGFRTGAGVPAWLAVAGLLVLLTLSLTWLAILAGVSARSVDGASAFAYPLILLPFLSSAFVPTASMPAPVRWFADHQPVTSIVDTVRALFAQEPVGSEIWVAVAWCVGLLVLFWALAVRVYRRRLA
ncbi:ABC transporter permease [Miniimonas arenae]|uniref:Transport permease protein n=1 Tax=Miniimonas arenae TaxID=676201 RepID=A0A5C5BEZ4_9MICO|nr:MULTISPECIES: ABC transporter permease [Miniimonas]TNU76656.1 ABC transporter permease [Miniimonas arenae]